MIKDKIFDKDLNDKILESEFYKNIKESEVDEIVKMIPFYGVLINTFWLYWCLFNSEKNFAGFDYAKFVFVKYDMIQYYMKKDPHTFKNFIQN